MKIYLLKNKSLSFGKTCNSRVQFFHLFIPLFLDQKIYLNIRFGGEFKSRFCKRIQGLLHTAKCLSAFCILTFGTVALTTYKSKSLAFYLTSLIPFFCTLLRSNRAYICAIYFFADLHFLSVYVDVKLLLLFGFHEKSPSPNRNAGKGEHGKRNFSSHSARNKGMARKRYFPLFFPKQEKPYVSLALIANQAFNIFFDPFQQWIRLFLA